MTEYKGTKGGAVQNFEEDPDNPIVGQVWYNETTGNLRVRQTTLTSAWASGGNMNTARSRPGGAGTQTAALAFGGDTPSSPPVIGNTESYDGSSWTEVNDLNTARAQLGGCGASNTAALAFGGMVPTSTPNNVALTEIWNIYICYFGNWWTTSNWKCRILEWNELDGSCKYKSL